IKSIIVSTSQASKRGSKKVKVETQVASLCATTSAYFELLRKPLASPISGGRPDEPFPLWREQPQDGRDQEQGWNITHEVAVLSTVVKRLCPHDRRVHDA